MTVLTMLSLALAGSGPMFAPAAPESTGQMVAMGGTHADGGRDTISMSSTMQRSFGRHVGGLHIGAYESAGALDKHGMFSLSGFYGFQVVKAKHVVVMPFVHAGGFVQAGIAGRVEAPIGSVRIGADASVGATWELPFERRQLLDRDERDRVYGVLPEAGVFVDLGGTLRPTARIGAQGVNPVVSVQLGGPLFVRGALAYDVLRDSLSGWAGLGFRLN